jgi:hypothetical protein
MSNNATFLVGVRAFFRRYPVTTVADGQIAQAGFAPFKPSNKGQYGEDDLEVVEKTNRVVFCDIGTDANAAGQAGVFSPNVGTPVKVTLQPSNTGTSIPVFYLKYDLNHNRRMTLVDRRSPLPMGPAPPDPWRYADNAADIGNVTFFLTDCVDGCSVYVEGTPQNPTVYHINASMTLPPGVNTFPPATASWAKRERCWKLKWQKMDDRFKTQGTVVKALGWPGRTAPYPNVQPSSKVESRDYMFLKRSDEVAFEGMLAQLQLQVTVPNQVNGQNVDGMTVVFTQGTIFGIRRNGNWSFWVQKKVLVQYFHHAIIAHGNRTVGQKVTRVFTGNRPYNSVLLGSQWLVRSLDQFWPVVTTGRVVV